MTTTMQFTGTLAVEVCCSCGMSFAMPKDYQRRRRNDRAYFFCPAGHAQHYAGKSEAQLERERAEQLQRMLRTAQQSEEFYREQMASARRSAAAQKGHVTRLRNLIAKGICPVAGCRRNFTNVRDHMATEHPDFHAHEDGAR